MQKNVQLTTVLAVFAMVTIIILLVFSETVNIRSRTGTAITSVGLTPPQLTLHCSTIVLRRKPSAARPRTPPWEVLLNTAATNRTRLYVRVQDVYQGRLGNRLFKYASLFGIAWRNERVPLWPDALRTDFSLRIPSDHHNVNIKVSTCV